MWQRVLAEMAGQGMAVRFTDSWAPGRRGPDVWLIDGHSGPPDVDGPVVAYLHEAPWTEDAREHGLTPEFRSALAERGEASARRATMVITGTGWTRAQIARTHSVPESAIRVVPLGVDSQVFNPARAAPGRHLLDGHGCAGPFVAFVSSVHPRKNLPALRDAVALLAQRGFEHRLVMVLSPAADRPDSTALLEAARSELTDHPGRVVALDGLNEDEVAGVMAAASVMCVPSRSEGFGLTALEAMACGTPVVVANRGALPEVVGEAGLVAEPDARSLAEALGAVLSEPARRLAMSAAGLERAYRLTWAATARGWTEALEEAASS